MTQSISPLSHPASVDPRATVLDMIGTATSTLRLARSLLETGRQLDIEGLDRMIGVLCARALDLPPDQGRIVRPALALLLIELDILSVAMQPA